MREFSALADRCKDVRRWLDYRAAIICTVMANSWRSSKSRPFAIEDFMPGKEHRRQTQKEMLAAVKLMNAAYSNKIVKEKP